MKTNLSVIMVLGTSLAILAPVATVDAAPDTRGVAVRKQEQLEQEIRADRTAPVVAPEPLPDPGEYEDEEEAKEGSPIPGVYEEEEEEAEQEDEEAGEVQGQDEEEILYVTDPGVYGDEDPESGPGEGPAPEPGGDESPHDAAGLPDPGSEDEALESMAGPGEMPEHRDSPDPGVYGDEAADAGVAEDDMELGESVSPDPGIYGDDPDGESKDDPPQTRAG